jgi:hypothetical protein
MERRGLVLGHGHRGDDRTKRDRRRERAMGRGSVKHGSR